MDLLAPEWSQVKVWWTELRAELTWSLLGEPGECSTNKKSHLVPQRSSPRNREPDARRHRVNHVSANEAPDFVTTGSGLAGLRLRRQVCFPKNVWWWAWWKDVARKNLTWKAKKWSNCVKRSKCDTRERNNFRSDSEYRFWTERWPNNSTFIGLVWNARARHSGYLGQPQ